MRNHVVSCQYSNEKSITQSPGRFLLSCYNFALMLYKKCTHSQLLRQASFFQKCIFRYTTIFVNIFKGKITTKLDLKYCMQRKVFIYELPKVISISKGKSIFKPKQITILLFLTATRVRRSQLCFFSSRLSTWSQLFEGWMTLSNGSGG